MKAKIVGFRGSYRDPDYRNVLIRLIDADPYKTKAIGRKVRLKINEKTWINGKIIKFHGNNGVLLVRFERGIPPFTLGWEVEVK